MTYASDQNSDEQQLSDTSQKMLALREAVFAEWEKRVRASSKEAAVLRRPILIDTFPSFYDNIAEAITPDYPRATGEDCNSVASEHGRERARVTGYDHQMLVREYQILRHTIFDVMQRNGLQLTHAEATVINVSVDDAVASAVSAFVSVHYELRERFFAALAHDLRGPLSAVSLAAEVILRASDPVKIRHHATRIGAHAKRIDEMITGLLDSAVFQAGHALKMDIGEFDMLEVLQEMLARATESGEHKIQILGESVKGWWCREAMVRALDNMVNNAMKYGARDAPISIRLDQANGRIMLSVHNEGPPIPHHEQEAIFQMYHRARSVDESGQKGWGIGLPYVRTVAESHGGSVSVDSDGQRGTTFLLDIPVDARPFSKSTEEPD